MSVWAVVQAPYEAQGEDQVSGQPGDRFQIIEGEFLISFIGGIERCGVGQNDVSKRLTGKLCRISRWVV